MPRPLVEVRQAVLNPVITINDPQQEVCLIGLHTADFVDQEVNVLDLPGTADQGAEVHVGAAAEHVFTIDAEGVFIDAAVDFGPDAYDISGDHTLKVSEAYISVSDVSTGYNTTDVTAVPDLSKVVITEIGGLATILSEAGEGNSVLVAQPVSSYCNKLIYQGGDPINFVTDNYFKHINAGDRVAFKDTTDTARVFLVIRKEADCVYLRGTDADTYGALESNIGFQLLDPNNTANVLGALADTTFSLVHPGIHESVLSSGVTNDGTHDTITLVTPLPFVLDDADKADFQGTIITRVAESDIDALKVSEVDAGNPLVISVDDSGDATVTVPAARMKDANDKPIARAKFTMSYTVAKNNLSASVASIDETTLTSVLGEASPRNPLRLAAELALLNSGSSRINILALDITPPDGTTELRSVEDAFLNALSIINRNANMYAIAPLTVNATVTKAYANAAESLSAPAKGKFRICLGSSEGAPLLDFIIGSANTPALQGSNSNGTVTNLAGDMYRLPTSKVLEGDSIVATVGNTIHTGTVDAVSNTALTVTWDNDPGNTVFDGGYYVARSLAATHNIPRQIEILAAQAEAIASKRLFLTFPGSCTVASGDDLFVGLPSYYVTAAFAGLMARLEIHRPKNYLGLTGIVGLQDFNRFDDEQLDQISDAGYLVFQQEEATSAPFCIHQVNTRHGIAAGTQEFTELSVLANFDFVSRYMKEVLDPFAGTMNVVPSTLGLIRSSLDAAMENLKARRTALIGAPLLSGSVEFVRQASYDQGTIEASVLVSLPKVLNKIIIEVVSG